MRIGFDAKRLFNNFTGLGNYSRTLVNNLSRYAPGHQIDLYTTHISDRIDITPYQRNPKVCIKDYNGAFKSFWRTFGLINWLKRDDLDVYHGLSNELPRGIQKLGIPAVVSIHDLIFKRLPHTYPVIDRQLYDWKFRYACHHADLILAVSECTRSDIINYYKIVPEKIKVLYQACDPIFYSDIEDDHLQKRIEKWSLPEEYLLYVGSVTERKNLLIAIEALAKLPVDDQLPLVIVGRGKSYQHHVKRRAMELGVANRLIWLSDVTMPLDLRAIYKSALMLLHPSRFEGFGIPIVEALLSHVPVLANNNSAQREAGGPGALYLDSDSASEWSDTIRDLLSDDQKRRNLAEAGYKFAVERFNSKLLTAHLLQYYESVI